MTGEARERAEARRWIEKDRKDIERLTAGMSLEDVAPYFEKVDAALASFDALAERVEAAEKDVRLAEAYRSGGFVAMRDAFNDLARFQEMHYREILAAEAREKTLREALRKFMAAYPRELHIGRAVEYEIRVSETTLNEAQAALSLEHPEAT